DVLEVPYIRCGIASRLHTFPERVPCRTFSSRGRNSDHPRNTSNGSNTAMPPHVFLVLEAVRRRGGLADWRRCAKARTSVQHADPCGYRGCDASSRILGQFYAPTVGRDGTEHEYRENPGT